MVGVKRESFSESSLLLGVLITKSFGRTPAPLTTKKDVNINFCCCTYNKNITVVISVATITLLVNKWNTKAPKHTFNEYIISSSKSYFDFGNTISDYNTEIN